MKLIYKNQKKMPSKFGGDMYYLFFNDGEKSYRTCIYTAFRNYHKWERLIRNIKKGFLDINSYQDISFSFYFSLIAEM